AEAAHDAGTHDCELGLPPGPAGADLAGIRLLVQSHLPGALPLEVLHDVRDVDVVAFDPGRLQRAVEHATGRTHERMPLPILHVTRLLPEHHHRRRRWSLAEDGLRRVRVQRARMAARRLLAERRELGAGRPPARNVGLRGTSSGTLAHLFRVPVPAFRETGRGTGRDGDRGPGPGMDTAWRGPRRDRARPRA